LLGYELQQTTAAIGEEVMANRDGVRRAFRGLLVSTTGLTCLGLAGTVTAQTPLTSDQAVPASAETGAAPTGNDEIIVTGSRLATDGTKTPTPVTVASAEQLQLSAPRTLTEALTQLPAFKGSVGVQTQGTGTTGNNGASYLNLRGLGTSRTLVLLDGRRVVAASSAGSVDISLLPEALIRQVEIVTGGASAAYGSDAVAGVVNFILDTRLEGLRATAQGGLTDKGDAGNYKFSFAGGTNPDYSVRPDGA